jgi:hypothetical protein
MHNGSAIELYPYLLTIVVGVRIPRGQCRGARVAGGGAAPAGLGSGGGGGLETEARSGGSGLESLDGHFLRERGVIQIC